MQPARQLRRQRSGRVVETDAPATAGLRGAQDLEIDTPLGLLPGWKGGGARGRRHCSRNGGTARRRQQERHVGRAGCGARLFSTLPDFVKAGCRRDRALQAASRQDAAGKHAVELPAGCETHLEGRHG